MVYLEVCKGNREGMMGRFRSGAYWGDKGLSPPITFL